MVNAETLAGGWYKSFYDYLILSHSLRDWELGEFRFTEFLWCFTSTMKKERERFTPPSLPLSIQPAYPI